MRILIVEDDFVSRALVSALVAPFGSAEIAVDGSEAVEAVRTALEAKNPYDVIFLDIMMPNLDGHGALEKIRGLEEENQIPLEQGAKIVMTTALNDSKNVMKSFNNMADGYLVKPITKEGLLKQLKDFEQV
jgi:two-component system chemotaxis response regulator CheY